MAKKGSFVCKIRNLFCDGAFFSMEFHNFAVLQTPEKVRNRHFPNVCSVSFDGVAEECIIRMQPDGPSLVHVVFHVCLLWVQGLSLPVDVEKRSGTRGKSGQHRAFRFLTGRSP